MSEELRVVPCSIQQAQEFVQLHHRHHQMPTSGSWAVALLQGDDLVGVAIAGRPVSRVLERKGFCEITRVCVLEGVPNGCSMLYGRCRRIAQAFGYVRVITYTQAGETGASLRAAGYRLAATLAARGSWRDHSVKRKHAQSKIGTGGVERLRWESP